MDVTDLEILTRQMGRAPRGVIAIARRCPAGHPCVVRSYPLRREGDRLSPFPTIYWLTCPALCQQLSELERKGTIAILEAELRTEPALREDLIATHRRCVEERWTMLSPEDRVAVTTAGLLPEFERCGLGGMENWSAIKCLHLHYAQHLVHGNEIGRRLESRFGLRLCAAT